MYGLAGVESHLFIRWQWTEMCGQLHVPVSFPWGKNIRYLLHMYKVFHIIS